jgi:hypothetical protein
MSTAIPLPPLWASGPVTGYLYLIVYGRNVAFMRVHEIAKSDYKPRHVCPSACPFVWNNRAPTGRMFMVFDICVSFEHLSIKFKFHENLIKTGTLHEYLSTFMIIKR